MRCTSGCPSLPDRLSSQPFSVPDARPNRRPPIEPEQLSTELAKVAIDKKAFDVVILDLRALVDYCDLFVICSASNRRQVQAIAEAVRLHGKHTLHQGNPGVEGMEAARWVLVDFGDVVVHVFDDPLRGFYNLDGLWSDAPRLPVPEGGAPRPDDAFEDDDDLLPQPG